MEISTKFYEIESLSGSVAPALNEKDAKSGAFISLNKYRCLIINPGPTSVELLSEPFFQKYHNADVLTVNRSSNLVSIIDEGGYTIVLLDSSGEKTLTKEQLKDLNKLKINNVQVYDLVLYYEKITCRIPLVHLSESWIINNDLFFVDTTWKFLFLKRLFDIIFSLALLPFVLIVLIPAILLIKLTTKGPAFFVQERIGKGGKPFNIFKLRTMTVQGANQGFTLKNDIRITPIGKILRKTKIDELPQIFNILAGDMAFVGPRPEKKDIVEDFANDNPYYVLRHMVRPGVTGWAQVNHPTATPLENLQKLEYDLFYIKNMSPIWDIKVIWHTFRVVLTLDSL